MATNASKHVLAELKADHVSHNASCYRQQKSHCLPRLAPLDWTSEVVKSAGQPTMEQIQTALPLANGDAGNQQVRASSGLAAIVSAGDAAEALVPGTKKRPSAQDCIAQICEGVQCEQAPARKVSRFNGYSLHLKNAWESAGRFAGESKKDMERRVFGEASFT